ncbi:putative GPI ethanolamine phosphate transferase [Planoprotostelium fungivorum]|uniref:Putative GPI ethanolamine phosphate transferase n=1 Tax=Planoprotostelium fungivorum TaxID=1890364 RepID=A0A2P6NIW7_9EUKA|nr:putative GPI ethanolamine phosphate transferase [Planoprotostelium fungivorum]
MQKSHGALLYVFWLTLLHIAGIYIFSSGFLLTRYELPQRSTCDIAPSPLSFQIRDSIFPDLKAEGDDSCWFPKRFNKSVIMVIDALRFDYVEMDPFVDENSTRYNQNKLPSIYHILRDRPSSSHLFRFIADPPTVTMQRLKGMTTGGMPTFIDVSSNFASTKIQEDNMISQFSSNNKNITFMGDDTWMSLYSDHINVSFPFDSFNVYDLHTVDNGIISNLIPQMVKNDWNVLIAHFLGVDHVGHRFQSNAPAMKEKLAQMDEVIQQVTSTIDSSTMLLIMGDHGATDSGDHGGSSQQEVESALFTYSRTQSMNNPFPSSKDVTHAISRHNSIVESSYRSVPQVDLVPTLCLLMGVPIPFGNLGLIVPEYFLESSEHAQYLMNSVNPTESDVQRLIITNYALHLNIAQVIRYIETYSKMSKSFSHEAITKMKRDATQNDQLLLHLTQSPDVDYVRAYQQHRKIFSSYRQIHTEISTLCRELWVTFDTNSMLMGCAVLFIAFISVIQNIVAIHTHSSKVYNQPDVYARLTSAVIIGGILWIIKSTYHVQITWPQHVVVSYSMSYVFCMLEFHWPSRSSVSSFINNVSENSVTKNVVIIVSLTLHLVGLCSNSYIEMEKHVIRFLIASVAGLICLSTLSDVRAQMDSWSPIYNWFGHCIVFALTRLTSGGVYDLQEGNWTVMMMSVITIISGCVYIVRLDVTKENISFVDQISFLTNASLVIFMWILSPLPSLQWIKLAVPWILYVTCSLQSARIIFSSSTPIGRILRFTIVNLPLCVMILGFWGPLHILLVSLQTFFFYVQLQTNSSGRSERFPFFASATVTLMMISFYFSQGHDYQLSTFHWRVAFLGLNQLNLVIGAILVVFETFMSHYLLVLSLVFMVYFWSSRDYKHSNPLWEELMGPLLTCIAVFNSRSLVTSIFVFGARRHLMVWRVFAPKYIFDNIFLLVLDALVIFILLMVRPEFRKLRTK